MTVEVQELVSKFEELQSNNERFKSDVMSQLADAKSELAATKSRLQAAETQLAIGQPMQPSRSAMQPGSMDPADDYYKRTFELHLPHLIPQEHSEREHAGGAGHGDPEERAGG